MLLAGDKASLEYMQREYNYAIDNYFELLKIRDGLILQRKKIPQHLLFEIADFSNRARHLDERMMPLVLLNKEIVIKPMRVINITRHERNKKSKNSKVQRPI